MVRRISVISVLIFFYCLNLMAQEPETELQKIRLGIKIAPSVIWMKSKSKFVDGDGSKIGFSYGLMLDVNLSKNYAFGTGIDIAYRGGKLKVDGDYTVTNEDIAATYTLQYIQIPITIKMMTNEMGYIRYFGQLGFESGFNISAKGTDVDNYPSSPGDKESIAGQIAPFNLALLLQLGLEYSIGGKTSLAFSLYYSNGFLDVISSVQPNYDARSNGLGLNIGVFF